MGMSVIYESIIKNVPVSVEEEIMKWDFIPLSINDFDAILGMDGLSHYQANIDYSERHLKFVLENEREIRFKG